MTLPSAGAAAGDARRLRRNLIYVASALMDGGLAFFQVGMGYRAREEFAASEAGLGLLALVGAGSYAVCCLIFGRLSDRWGRRRLIIGGALLDAACLLLAARAGSFAALCVLAGLFSAGQGAFWPPLEADIGDHSGPRELARRLGRFNMAWCAGLAAGFPLAGALGQAFGQRWVLAAGAALALLSLLAYLGRSFEPEALPESAPDPVAEARAAARAGSFRWMGLVLNFAAMGLSGTLRSQVSAVTGGEHSALGGLYGALFFAAQVAAFAALAGWSGWHYRAAPLAAGMAAGVAGAALCGLFRAPLGFGAGCLLAGAGCGLAYYSSIYYSIAAAAEKGHRGGVHEAVLGAGSGMVPQAGGLLAGAGWVKDRVSWTPGVPFLFAAAALAGASGAAGLIYAGLRRRAASAVSGGPR